jgi:hypothetical protein
VDSPPAPGKQAGIRFLVADMTTRAMSFPCLRIGGNDGNVAGDRRGASGMIFRAAETPAPGSAVLGGYVSAG